MKKRLLCLLMVLGIVLLSGCQSLPASPVRAQAEVKELTLAIPKGSTDLLREVARELSRRASDFASNSLTVDIVEVSNIWKVLEEGSADLVVCENGQAMDAAEKLEKLSYPEVFRTEELTTEEQIALPKPEISGDAAMLAMLDYPFFFYDMECIVHGGNDAEVLAALNHSLPEGFPMELKRLSYSGKYHLVTNNWQALEDYLLEKPAEDILYDLLARGEPLWNPWGYLTEGELYLREVDLTSTKSDLSERSILLSEQRGKIVTIYSNPESMGQLSELEQAAIEEAIVYSGGYSRTLADDQQTTILNQLEAEGIPLIRIDVDDWYDAFQWVYTSGEYEINAELAELLQDKIERFH